ncbi:hypothetical protein EW146_g700 [Bondarzewia mesenterica]|uniref:Uncharacterized protein n=1 Tax=Bondarzewia mesenterica TaxID=1095465 RepID=A0A4S4M6H6_9AGAM|nr:hypothetical protein EW146_g700 [Bondarzewia mesenterica]
MNQYKLWKPKPDVHLDYDSDRPRQRLPTPHQAPADSRTGTRMDIKHQHPGRGYVSEEHTYSRAPPPPAHYNTLHSSSKPARHANPSSSQFPSHPQYPTASSHKVTTSSNVNAVPTSSASRPHRNLESAYDARAYQYRPSTADRIPSSTEKIRPANELGNGSRHRTQNPGHATLVANAISTTVQASSAWPAPSQEPKKSSSKHRENGLEKTKEAEREERAREKEKRKEERRREEQRKEDARREQEVRYEEERRRQKEERRREREERRRAEERYQAQKAQEEKQRAEQNRVVEDISRGTSHMQPVMKESRHRRVKDSDESDNFFERAPQPRAASSPSPRLRHFF